MPLQQRVIEPVNVTRSTLPLPPGDIRPLIKTIAASTGQGLIANAAAAANINIPNELECVTNGTLANLIRQLSSLSRQAEELLSGVFNDASKLLTRAVNLQQRMDSLAIKIDSLDQPNDACIILRDAANQRETFSSDMSYEQQILSKDQMPSSISELYQTCDKPPPLNILDPYRDDGKDGLKFYTDPTYFFELWKKDMMKETAAAPQDQRSHTVSLSKANQNSKTLQHKRAPQPNAQQLMHQPMQMYQTTKSKQHVVSINGSYLPPEGSIRQTYVQASGPIGNQNLGEKTEAMIRHMNEASINDDQIYVQQQNQQQALHAHQQAPQTSQINQFKQPQPQSHYELYQKQQSSQPSPQIQPPLQQADQTQFQQSYSQSPYNPGHQSSSNPPHMLATPPPPPALSPLPPPSSPPPPPPPPPPAPPAPPQGPSQPAPALQLPTAAQLQQKQQQLKKTLPVQRDPRTELLAAIKQGITLRRVEDSKRRVEAEKQQSMGNDVASILARRVAMQVSDSDDNGDDEEGDNDWDDSTNR